MGTYELDSEALSCNKDCRRVNEECIIANKIYDQCRQLDCNKIHH